MGVRLERIVSTLAAGAPVVKPVCRNVPFPPMDRRTNTFGRFFDHLARRFYGGDLGRVNAGHDLIDEETKQAFEVKAVRHGDEVVVGDTTFNEMEASANKGWSMWFVLYRHPLAKWRDSDEPIASVLRTAARSPLVMVTAPLHVLLGAREDSRYAKRGLSVLYEPCVRYKATFVNDLLLNYGSVIERIGEKPKEYVQRSYRTSRVSISGIPVAPHPFTIIEHRDAPLKSIVPF